MGALERFFRYISKISLVMLILIALVLGMLLAQIWPEMARNMSLLGKLFITALKSVAPILVLFLVTASIARHQKGQQTNIKPILVLYLLGTFSAALIAVLASFVFPSTITLKATEAALQQPPSGVVQVLRLLLFKMVDNPVNALLNANYIGLLVWGAGLGLALRHASESTKAVLFDLSYSISFIVKLIIYLAPLGIFGLVSSTLAETGFDELRKYAHLLAVLLGSMLVVVLIVNPILVFWKTRSNPYPLIFMTLRESAITAFFTRSSAANIPVNMALCKKMGLPEETYSISIPLGATINMAGAAITITVLTLAAVKTLNYDVDIFTALLLSVVAALCACGASGVAGGSLLLIPVACSLFGISNDIAMQVVGVGFIIGVIQDSAETAVNSSVDVVFTAAVCEAERRKQGQMPA